MKGPTILCDPPGPRAKEWIKRWKSCSPLQPIYTTFVEGEGIYIKDVDNNVYMDFFVQSSNVGHKNPNVIKAVMNQLDDSGVSRLRGPSIPRILLMEKIKKIVPPKLSDGKFEFCNTGSDAAEFSMQLARSYTRKALIISYIGGHYGYSIGALSLTADISENRRHCFPLVPGIIHIPYPYCYRCPFGKIYPECEFQCINYIKYLFETVVHPNETSSFFIESIQQYGGVITPPKKYFNILRKICDEYNILLVDDEVATGFGRTGKMFGIEHYNVEPDIMFLGKPFANGISIAGIMAKKEIMEKEENNPVVKGGSFAGNLVSCVSALTVIDEILDNNLIENSEKMGDYLIKRLTELKEKYEIIGDVRGKGLLIGIELVEDLKTKKPATTKTQQIINEAFKRGLLVGCVGTYKQVIRLTPPLIITKEECEIAVQIIENSINAIVY